MCAQAEDTKKCATDQQQRRKERTFAQAQVRDNSKLALAYKRMTETL